MYIYIVGKLSKVTIIIATIALLYSVGEHLYRVNSFGTELRVKELDIKGTELKL